MRSSLGSYTLGAVAANFSKITGFKFQYGMSKIYGAIYLWKRRFADNQWFSRFRC